MRGGCGFWIWPYRAYVFWGTGVQGMGALAALGKRRGIQGILGSGFGKNALWRGAANACSCPKSTQPNIETGAVKCQA
jgi:hypothetical protein